LYKLTDRERELRPLVPDQYQVKIIRQEKYISLSLPLPLSLSCTNAINLCLLCAAQLLVSGEVDPFWRRVLTSSQCVLQSRSMRRWDQHGVGEDFFTEDVQGKLTRGIFSE
jgi:hypothetical protein